LVTSGIYAIIRHPSYLGLLVGSLGWALAFRSDIGVLPVGRIIARAGAQIAATEERDAKQDEVCDREVNQSRVGEEGGEPAPAKDGEAEIGEGPYHGDERESESGCRSHGVISLPLCCCSRFGVVAGAGTIGPLSSVELFCGAHARRRRTPAITAQ
jgi:hypothetical protein